MKRVMYLKCPSCNYIISLESGKATKSPSEPCPICKSSDETLQNWPPVVVKKFLQIVNKQKLNDRDGKRIAIVFLCSALEILLEETIWELLTLHAKTYELSEVILKSNRGKERRIELYDRLSDCSLGKLLRTKKLQTFLEDWSKLTKLRNKIIHGKYYVRLEYVKPEDEITIIENILKNCFRVFAEMHNDIQRQKKKR